MVTNDKISKVFNTDIPLLLAPMAGAADSAMAIGVAKAGGLGSPCLRHAQRATDSLRSSGFHFGVPKADFVSRLKNGGCKILSSATTLKEALWLEEHGC